MKNYYAAVILIVLLGIAGFIFLSKKTTTTTTTNCDPATCVATETVAISTPITFATTTKTFFDQSQGIGFDYLDNFYFDANADKLTDYIHPVEWPPQISVATSTYTCKTTGTTIGPNGSTEIKKINGNSYCLTRQSEGAAGSTYTTYTYKKLIDKKTVNLTFIVRFPQCVNYDQPKQNECKNEESNFDIDTMVDKIFSTVVFK